MNERRPDVTGRRLLVVVVVLVLAASGCGGSDDAADEGGAKASGSTTTADEGTGSSSSAVATEPESTATAPTVLTATSVEEATGSPLNEVEDALFGTEGATAKIPLPCTASEAEADVSGAFSGYNAGLKGFTVYHRVLEFEDADAASAVLAGWTSEGSCEDGEVSAYPQNVEQSESPDWSALPVDEATAAEVNLDDVGVYGTVVLARSGSTVSLLLADAEPQQLAEMLGVVFGLDEVPMIFKSQANSGTDQSGDGALFCPTIDQLSGMEETALFQAIAIGWDALANNIPADAPPSLGDAADALSASFESNDGQAAAKLATFMTEAEAYCT